MSIFPQTQPQTQPHLQAQRRPAPRLRRRLCAAAMAAAGACTTASAHDTWFERLSAAGASSPALLALGTGDQYPRRETGVGAEYLQQQGCRGTAAAAAASQRSPGDPAPAPAPASALVPVRNVAAALLLRAPVGAQGCWAQLTPFDIELPADKVAPYLDELNADASLRATWAAMQAQGLRWQERYTKHARIELDPGGAENPVPMGMDALLHRRAGQFVFTVLRDGQPLPGQAVELRGTAPAAASWHRTDDQGQLRLPEPPPGRWLLRAIDLRPSATAPGQWDSRFLTLAFDAGSRGAAVATQQPLQR